MFSSRNWMELLLFFNVKSKNAVKLVANATCEILYYRAAFFSFWKVMRCCDAGLAALIWMDTNVFFFT